MSHVQRREEIVALRGGIVVSRGKISLAAFQHTEHRNPSRQAASLLTQCHHACRDPDTLGWVPSCPAHRRNRAGLSCSVPRPKPSQWPQAPNNDSFQKQLETPLRRKALTLETVWSLPRGQELVKQNRTESRAQHAPQHGKIDSRLLLKLVAGLVGCSGPT